MKVISFIYDSPFELVANGYLLIDSNNDCVVIDPGKADSKVINYLKDNNLSLKAVLLTHGHFDHIGGVPQIVKEFAVPVYIHKNDEQFLYNSRLNCSSRFSRKDIAFDKSIKVEIIDKEKQIDLLESPVQVIETPFHTMGSICYLITQENILFSGDTLFNESIGRSDLEGSNPSLINESLAKLMALKDEVKVYPGHGLETTIGHEKKQNSFVNK